MLQVLRLYCAQARPNMSMRAQVAKRAVPCRRCCKRVASVIRAALRKGSGAASDKLCSKHSCRLPGLQRKRAQLCVWGQCSAVLGSVLFPKLAVPKPVTSAGSAFLLLAAALAAQLATPCMCAQVDQSIGGFERKGRAA